MTTQDLNFTLKELKKLEQKRFDNKPRKVKTTITIYTKTYRTESERKIFENWGK